MKSNLILILFVLVYQFNWAQEKTALPKEPWEAIVDMAQNSPDAFVYITLYT
ncbi:hypothetical protein [Carboxylicivirga linearis]|uniref:Serine hydrolase n=1 Tax=Carboxylicivirga linearis TaxID=1628157 RepID=A0ABS5JTA7_9BACT|nr:hypothetical protein [Carboxylicivirga linearis]MBS2098115.1 hypothetical protein [Carboxylicivirga linearis]